MRVLLDEHLPFDLMAEFVDQDVANVRSQGWAGLKSGVLLESTRSTFLPSDWASWFWMLHPTGCETSCSEFQELSKPLLWSSRARCATLVVNFQQYAESRR